MASRKKTEPQEEKNTQTGSEKPAFDTPKASPKKSRRTQESLDKGDACDKEKERPLPTPVEKIEK